MTTTPGPIHPALDCEDIIEAISFAVDDWSDEEILNAALVSTTWLNSFLRQLWSMHKTLDSLLFILKGFEGASREEAVGPSIPPRDDPRCKRRRKYASWLSRFRPSIITVTFDTVKILENFRAHMRIFNKRELFSGLKTLNWGRYLSGSSAVSDPHILEYAPLELRSAFLHLGSKKAEVVLSYLPTFPKLTRLAISSSREPYTNPTSEMPVSPHTIQTIKVSLNSFEYLQNLSISTRYLHSSFFLELASTLR